jgi:hypothetical protein
MRGMRTESQDFADRLVVALAGLLLYFIAFGILGPHPSKGPIGPMLPAPIGPAWDDDLRPKCECDEDDCECAGDDGTTCTCPTAIFK